MNEKYSWLLSLCPPFLQPASNCSFFFLLFLKAVIVFTVTAIISPSLVFEERRKDFDCEQS